MHDDGPTNHLAIEGTRALRGMVGHQLGISEWIAVDQSTITAFAVLTGDDQWIHVDESRAATESPYGSTIAHGFLLLSLLPRLVYSMFDVTDVGMAINYGVDGVRFLAPVPAGSRIRLRTTLAATRETTRGLLAEFDYTVELEGSQKPACVMRKLTLYVDRS